MTRPEIALIHRVVNFVIRRSPASDEIKQRLLSDMGEIFKDLEEELTNNKEDL